MNEYERVALKSLKPFDLVVRSDGRCRAVRGDIVLTGWCKDIWAVRRTVHLNHLLATAKKDD